MDSFLSGAATHAAQRRRIRLATECCGRAKKPLKPTLPPPPFRHGNARGVCRQYGLRSSFVILFI